MKAKIDVDMKNIYINVGETPTEDETLLIYYEKTPIKSFRADFWLSIVFASKCFPRSQLQISSGVIITAIKHYYWMLQLT